MKLGAIGECMLEISDAQTDDSKGTSIAAALGFGGDSLNTLIYAARLKVECFYFTALGTDPYSDWLLSAWADEGIHTDFVQRIEDKLPGLYAIQVDSRGERQFCYWRKDSAASHYLNRIDEVALYQQLGQLDVIYLSGITLGVFDDCQRERLLKVIQRLSEAGKTIAFDGNYRPRNWQSAEQAQQWITQILRFVDWYLPTLDDEVLLFGVKSVDDVINLHQSHNIRELIIKDGPNGCWVVTKESKHNVPIPQVITPVDTTAAGDSFNAGYLAGRMRNKTPREAAALGHQTAGQVIQHHGAIVPKSEFRKLL